MPLFVVLTNSMSVSLGRSIFPTFEFGNTEGEEPRKQSGKAHFSHLLFAERLHLFGSTVHRELAVLIAIAAIHGRFRAVRFRTTPGRIILHRHPTTLAKFVGLGHNVISLVEVISNCWQVSGMSFAANRPIVQPNLAEINPCGKGFIVTRH